ncbi:MAG TPA: superoxide dismutase, partial [Bacteroidales bacterium]|nr:superoxide dismutase [Bacteroidales bacterium]
MNFTLPELPFSTDALEPVISRQTIEFHYEKHHQAYVNNLNKLTEGSEWSKKSLEELVRLTEGGIYNNAAQVWNHTFYWESLVPSGNTKPGGKLMQTIEKSFGTYDSFKEQFTQASVTLFGSGWTWLVKTRNNGLKIIQGPNAWNPLREDYIPILTCDVWEHAYYLDFQNRRPDYVEEFFKLINW